MADYDSTVGVKLTDDFSSLLNGLKEIQQAILNLKVDMNGLYETSSKLRNVLKNVNLSGLNGSVSSAQTIASSTLQNAKNSIKSQSSVLQKMMAQARASASTGTSQISGSLVGLNDVNGTRQKQITDYQQKISSLGKSLDDLGNKSSKNSTKFWKFFDLNRLYFYSNYFKQVFRGIGSVIQSSLDFTETENYFARAMGNMYDEALKFQNKLSDMFGTAMGTTMNAQAIYKNMIGSLGGIEDELSYKLSETVTKMTLDFSSLYNVDFEDASKKFQSALSKQVRPIRSTSGYDITQNVLKQTAENIGMEKGLSDATELEKRLLVIITLMDQMRRSGAMNDFSRTIEQPANQLRVLKEQLIEVGRWLGSVFYGVLGQILPYINGFVMAIKEAVKWFALLIGYEIPNSSGQTGTILDSYGDVDAIEDVNDSIGGTGSALDDATKKAKEFDKTVSGIDKLNIIKKPTESDSTSGSGGGGTGGLGSIDPSILNALEKYNYMFDDIRMKAMDIRDSIIGWGNAAKEAIKENIFAPLQISWDKYGSSITTNFASGFTNLKTLVIDFAKTWADNWKPNFQSISDLFFSLLDTASLVFDTVTDFMLDVWNKGGKDLYNSLNELGRAFFKLATSINDNFVKPLVKWFKGVVSPALSDIVGLVLKMTSKVISMFSSVITWIAKCKPLVIALTTTVVTFFAAWKITKLISDFKLLRSSFTLFESLSSLLMNNSKLATKFFALFIDGKGKVTGFIGVYKNLSSVISNMGIWQSLVSSLGGVWSKISTLASGVPVLSSVVGALGTAFSFLAANPLVAVAVGVGAIVGAFALLSSSTERQKSDIEVLNEELDKNAKKIKKSADELSDLGKTTKNALSDTNSSFLTQQNALDKLVEMTGGKDGYVTNIESAKYYAELLNDALGESVSVNEQGLVIWQKTPDEIKKVVEQLKMKAQIEAYSQQYTEAMKNEIELNRQLAQAKNLQNQAQLEYNKYIDELLVRHPDWSKAQAEGFANTTDFGEALRKSNEQLKDATANYQENQVYIDNYDLAVQGLNGDVDALAQAHYNQITAGQAAESSWTSMRTGITQLQGDIQTATGIEKEAYQSSLTKLLDTYGQKMSNSKSTYAKLLEDLKNSGVNLSAEEERQLRESYDKHKKANEDEKAAFKQQKKDLMSLLKTYGIDKNSEDGKRYLNDLKNAQKEGKKSGEAYLEETKNGLKNKNKDVTSETDKTAKAMKKSFENKANQPEFKVKTSDATNAIEKVQSKASRNLSSTLTVNPRLSKTGIKIGDSRLTISMYASGGIPNVGEIFMARENGINEMVGRMGSRSAVANNDQIVDGIESGVFNAVVRALQMTGGASGSQPNYIENIFKIGEEVIEKQMVKANEKNILRTGKPLFNK